MTPLQTSPQTIFFSYDPPYSRGNISYIDLIKHLSFDDFRLADRSRREIVINTYFKATFDIAKTCTTPSCLNAAKKRILAAINQTQTISNVPCSITDREFGSRLVTLSLTLVGISSTRKY